MMWSIVLWSIYLNLFTVAAEWSITVLRPRLGSVPIKWHTMVTVSPSSSSFVILLKSLLSFRSLGLRLAIFSATYFSSGFLRNWIENTLSPTVSSSAASAVMLVGASLM